MAAQAQEASKKRNEKDTDTEQTVEDNENELQQGVGVTEIRLGHDLVLVCLGIMGLFPRVLFGKHVRGFVSWLVYSSLASRGVALKAFPGVMG